MSITQQRRAAYEAGPGRHASAERRSGSRGYSSQPFDRERGRLDRMQAHFQNQNPQLVRLNAVGSKETADRLSALDAAIKHLDALERHQMSSSQADSQVAEAMRKILNHIEKDEADTTKYNKYAQHRFANTETVVSGEFGKVRAIVDGQIANHFETLQERC